MRIYQAHPLNAVVLQHLKAGCKQGQRWSSGGSTDAETQFGIGWVFGGWAKEEGGWLREVVEEVQKVSPVAAAE